MPAISGEAAAMLDAIRLGGVVESEELADRSGLDAKQVGRALAELAGRGLVGGDHFDPIRLSSAGTRVGSAAGRSRRAGVRTAAGGRRGDRPWWGTAGVRWSAFSSSEGGGEAMPWALALLDRYGVVCRETASLDPWAPPWAVLRRALDVAELRGEVRRGYFVSGLSGVQFASEAFADRLARHRPGEEARPMLLCSLDPANLYGAGGLFDLPPVEGGGTRLVRSASNHLVLLRGRPVLYSEGFARRLTAMPWAHDRDLAAALATLSSLAGPSRRVLEVREIDGRPALESRLAAWLIEAGFVRDLHGLARYAGW
jgi:ATP-dependent Lhr-like helicase